MGVNYYTKIGKMALYKTKWTTFVVVAKMIRFACVACVKVGLFCAPTITQEKRVFGMLIVDRNRGAF